MILLVVAYVIVGIVVGAVAYVLSNPYGHISRAAQIRQGLFVGVFWLPCLVYVIALLIWDHFREREK